MLRTSTLIGAVFASALSAQGPCFETTLGTDLALSDDSIAQGLALGFTFTYAGVGYTDICVESNGGIYLGASTTAGADFSPTEAELLNSVQPRLCPLWLDLDPSAAGSGHVYFNTFPAVGATPARAVISWAHVYQYATTNPIEMQVELSANGTVRMTYGANAATGTANKILGASPGLGALSNPVSLATRPIAIAQDNFAEVLTGSQHTNAQMLWAPTAPGYVISDVGCTGNTLPVPAKVETLGTGCPVRSMPSIYEVFDAANAVDVSGTDFTFLPNGQGGYLVIPGIAGPMFTGFATNLGAGDDTTHAVALPFAFPHAYTTVSNIVVSSNGFLTLGTINPGSGCCAGSVANLLAGESRIAAWWSDLNATGAAVYADLDPVSGDFVVTWNNVFEYSTASVNRFQIALEPSGAFKIRLASVARVSHTFLLGYSYGHNSTNPGASNFAGIAAQDTGPLSLISPLVQSAVAGSTPKIGTTLNLQCSGISAAPQGNVAILFIGFTELNPGFDLAGLGAPGCNAYLLPGPSDLQFLNLTLGAPTTTFAVPVPNSLSLVGLQAISEIVSDDVGANSLGFKFSNGLRLTAGL